VRTILKHWKLSAIAAFSLTITMALGIVAFAISDTLLLRPPLARNPSELVSIFTSTPQERFGRVSYPDYEYYRDNNRVFTLAPVAVAMLAIASLIAFLAAWRATHLDPMEVLRHN